MLRAAATLLDYGVLSALLFAYIRYFGEPLDDGGYQTSGCGHLLVVMVMWVAWLPLPEAVSGRTFGKWVCELRVVDAGGGRAALRQVLIRRLLDPLDLSLFGLVGYVVAKNTPLAQRVGDLAAKTRVIQDITKSVPAV
jgi:uncharacterized RDD family membrane protein YckC